MNPVEISHLSRRYGRLEAVHDLSLSVPVGSICALLGPNGAGKSTTLRVLGGLLKATGGSAKVFGVDSFQLGIPEKLRLGYLDESLSQPDWMTVRAFLAYVRGFYPNWDARLEAELLSRFQLPLDRKLSALSRGMRMKAILISVTAYNPELLLLDEPFSGFDPVVREDVTRGLLEVVQSGRCTVLMSSHDMEEVERLADRIAIMQGGRLILSETVESLLARHRRLEVDLQGGAAFPAGSRRLDSWQQLEQAEGRVTFVDTAYNHLAAEAACRTCFPQAAIQVRPMTLREIYVHIARTQAGVGETAA